MKNVVANGISHYILGKDFQPIEAGLLEWAEFFGKPGARRIFLCEGDGLPYLSAVFIGVEDDIFETLDSRGYTEKFATIEELVVGVDRWMARWVKALQETKDFLSTSESTPQQDGTS